MKDVEIDSHGYFPCSFLKVNKVEDGITMINGRDKPLAAYLFTSNKKLEQEFVTNVSAGGLLINDTTLHVMKMI